MTQESKPERSLVERRKCIEIVEAELEGSPESTRRVLTRLINQIETIPEARPTPGGG